jgi:hypothetical protein
MNKPPPYNISKPSTTLDIHTVTKPSVTHKAKVLYDYDAAEDDELSLLADEVSRDPWLSHAASALFLRPKKKYVGFRFLLIKT